MDQPNHFTDRPKCGHAACIGRQHCIFTGKELAQPACRWADTDNGPCGGPSNGRECWDHKHLGRG